MGDAVFGDQAVHCQVVWDGGCGVAAGEVAEGGAVVEDESGAAGEARDEPVPHHPSGCGKVE